MKVAITESGIPSPYCLLEKETLINGLVLVFLMSCIASFDMVDISIADVSGFIPKYSRFSFACTSHGVLGPTYTIPSG